MAEHALIEVFVEDVQHKDSLLGTHDDDVRRFAVQVGLEEDPVRSA